MSITNSGRYLACLLGLVLCAGTAMAGSANSVVQTGERMPATNRPMSPQHILQMPVFQPGTLSNPVHVGDGHTIGYERAGWHYRVSYTYTAHGWQFAGYVATRMPATTSSHDASPNANERAEGTAPPIGKMSRVPDTMLSAYDGIGSGSSAPGPDDFNPPDTPQQDPDHTQHTTTSHCNFSGSGWDVQLQYTWVPAHFEETDDGDEIYVEGHWKLTKFTTEIGADYCNR